MASDNFYKGNTKIDKIYKGSSRVLNVYKGNTHIYQYAEHGLVLLEKSSAGTYYVEIPYDCRVHIDMVGAGGGGFDYRFGTTPNYNWRCSGGGSGAYISGSANVSAGTYAVVVGAGGNYRNDQGSPAYDGTATTFYGQSAGGGYGGGTSGGGSGGSYTATLTGLTGSNGNQGAFDLSSHSTHSCAGGASLYGGYGKGGNGGSSGNIQKGTDGYIKIYIV